MKKDITEEKKTYVLDLSKGGQRRITVPASWKVTFGPVYVPTGNKDYNQARQVWAIRFYEGAKENQRAIFIDVIAFRDASIDVMEKRVTVQNKSYRKEGEKGDKFYNVQAKMEQWVNPDDPSEGEDTEEYLRLPKDTEQIL